MATDGNSGDSHVEFSWDGFFIVLMSFSIIMLWGCIFKGLGVLLPTLTEQFVADTWLLGLMVSVMVVASDVAGLCTMTLEAKLGIRPAMLLSTLMVGVGLVLVAFASCLAHISLSLTFLVAFVSCTTSGRSSTSPTYLQAKGISPQTSANLCMAAAVGYFIGTVVFVRVIDKGLAKCSTMVLIVNLSCSLSLAVDPWVHGIPALAAITFVFGLGLSALFTLTDSLTKELLAVHRLSIAFGWIGLLSGLIRLLADAMPGWIYDTTDSYDLAFIIIGVVSSVALIPLAIGKLRKNI